MNRFAKKWTSDKNIMAFPILLYNTNFVLSYYALDCCASNIKLD